MSIVSALARQAGGAISSRAGKIARGISLKASSVKNPFRGFSHSPVGKSGKFVLDHGWQADILLSRLEAVTDKWLPKSTVAVSVKIWGNPQSNMSNLFYLACSVAANANPDPFRGFRGHVFQGVIVPHEKYVEVGIAHSVGGLLGGAGQSGRSLVKATIPDNYNADKVWPVFMQDKVDEPFLTTPKCNDQVIATMLGATNPVPQLDSISRQSDLTSLVAAALLGACDKVPCPKTADYVGSPTGATKRSNNPFNFFNSVKVGPDVNTVKLDTLKVPDSPTAVSQSCGGSSTSKITGS